MSQRHPDQHSLPMFITTNSRDRMPIFADQALANAAIEHLYQVQQFHPFFLFGFVIMPDHCHFLLTVPEPESISRIMRLYKMGLATVLNRGSIWQPRYHMRIAKDAWQMLDYIHQNPVKAGLVSRPDDYVWSSAAGKWDVSPIDGYRS